MLAVSGQLRLQRYLAMAKTTTVKLAPSKTTRDTTYMTLTRVGTEGWRATARGLFLSALSTAPMNRIGTQDLLGILEGFDIFADERIRDTEDREKHQAIVFDVQMLTQTLYRDLQKHERERGQPRPFTLEIKRWILTSLIDRANRMLESDVINAFRFLVTASDDIWPSEKAHGGEYAGRAVIPEDERKLILDLLRDSLAFTLQRIECMLREKHLPDEIVVALGKSRVHLAGAELLRSDLRNADLLAPVRCLEDAEFALARVDQFVRAFRWVDSLSDCVNTHITKVGIHVPFTVHLSVPTSCIERPSTDLVVTLYTSNISQEHAEATLDEVSKGMQQWLKLLGGIIAPGTAFTGKLRLIHATKNCGDVERLNLRVMFK